MRAFFLVLALFTGSLLSAQNKWEAQEALYKDSSTKAKALFYLQGGKELFTSNKTLSESLIRKGLALGADNKGWKTEYADMHNMMGILSMYANKYEEADEWYDKAIRLAKEIGSEAIVLKATTNIALNNTYRGEYQKSILQNLELLSLVEKRGNPIAIANTMANLSNNYYYIGQLKESESYQLKALALFEKEGYETGIANAYNTLGTIYSDQKQYTKALTYLKKSVAIKKENSDSVGLANTYINMGTLYAELKDYSNNLLYLEKALSLYTALGDKKGIMKAYSDLGTYYYEKGDYEKAKAYENKAIALAEHYKDDYTLVNLYRNISSSYNKLNQTDSALRFSKKALLQKDSLVEENLQKQISAMQVKYETEKAEKLVSEQRLLLAQSRLGITRRNYALGASALLFLLALVIFLSLYRRYRWKQEARLREAVWKQQEMATKAIIEAEEAERQRIAKDLHDGVGQLMSAAKMNLSAYEHQVSFASVDARESFGKIISLVDESCKEVRAVSHNMMPNALLKNSLAAAIREFIDKLDYKSLKVHLYTEGLDERLDSNTETVLYRVIQECVNNVIKHADANVLDMAVVRDRNEVTATIEDNGNGFDVANAEKQGGIGLKNIQSRIRYLKGTVDFDSVPGKGTLVAIHIPL